MLTRILLGMVFVLGFSGCATTHGNKAEGDQLHARVTELEKKLEEKDSEIVDLQYEVKDLSSKLDSGVSKAAPVVSEEAPMAVLDAKSHDILRVNVAPAKLQAALKGAGVYNGKIDGKIGSGTKAAIVEFQKSHGLTADGVVGRKTWDALKTYAAN